MKQKIKNIKGIYSNENETNISLEYNKKVTGVIDNTSLLAKDFTVKCKNDNKYEHFSVVTLDADKNNFIKSADTFVNKYTYDPLHYFMGINDGKICLYEIPDEITIDPKASFDILNEGSLIYIGAYESGLLSLKNTSNGGVSYFWEFGDGAKSTLFEPTHKYSYSGNFTVTLTMIDDDGNEYVATKVVDVQSKIYFNYKETPIDPINFEMHLTAISQIQANSALASWHTTQEATSKVIYGLALDSMTNEIEILDPKTKYHEIVIPNLDIEETYFAQMISSNGTTILYSDVYQFTTNDEIIVKLMLEGSSIVSEKVIGVNKNIEVNGLDVEQDNTFDGKYLDTELENTIIKPSSMDKTTDNNTMTTEIGITVT